MSTKELIKNFLNVSAEVEKLTEDFLHLSYNQINWKPADSQWSIGECFEHLTRTNEKYIPVYEKNKLHNGENKILEFKPTFLGKFVLKSIMPDNIRKYKTAAAFNPIGSKINEGIIKDFFNQNERIVELAKNIDQTKLKKKVSSPFLKLIKYNIGDSLLIVAYHNLRHILQAKRVLQNENFPSS